MYLDTKRHLLAIFIAPLSAGLGMTIAFANSEMSLSDFFISSFALIFITYPFALVGIALLGLPTLILLRKIRILNFYTLSLSGLVLGYFSTLLTGDLNDPLWTKVACIVGFVVSTTAALIMLKKPNKLKNESAASGTDVAKTRCPF